MRCIVLVNLNLFRPHNAYLTALFADLTVSLSPFKKSLTNSLADK